jgi:multidrug efflux system membrane fusion protein
MPNKQRHLWPGEFVNMRVQTQLQRAVLTIPASALERGPDGLFTYVVQPDSTIKVADLTVGEQSGGVVVVEKGLQPGDQVVASNQYRLQPGSRIKANATPAATPAVASAAEPRQ